MSGSPLETLDRAHALIRLGQFADAASELDALLARSPDNVEAWFTLGQAQGMRERHAAAEQAFRNAARLRPGMHEAHFNVALSLAYQEKLRESVGSFVAARALAPDIPGLEPALLEVLLQILQDEHHADAGAKPKLPAWPKRRCSRRRADADRLPMLRDALESVCAQSYRNWEAIVVNDGGEDISAVLRSLPAEAAGR